MTAQWLALVALVTAGTRTQKIAVLDMVDLSGEQGTLAKQLTQVVVSEVAARSDLKVISSTEVTQLLGYQRQKELLGCKDDTCLTELAGALGADFVMIEQLGRIGTRYRVDLRIADAQKANLVGSAGDFVTGSVDDVADATVRLTQQVLDQAKLGKPAPPHLAPTAATTETGASPHPLSVSSAAPAQGPSHAAAWAAWGVAGVLAVAAAVTTAVTISTFNTASSAADHNYLSDANSLSWKGPLADGLWAGALLAGGAGAYLYFSAAPAAAGSGAGIAMGGRF